MATRTKDADNTNNEVGSVTQSASSYLLAATRLSTSRPVGAPRVDTDTLTVNIGFDDIFVSNTDAVPGIYVIEYLPTLGVSRGPTSALNLAAFHEQNIIRSQISGNRSYEPVDHMIARICIDSMRELYDAGRRIYTMLSSFKAMNLYMPRAIFTAMGLDYDAWRSEAANFYQWLVNHKEALEPFPTVPIGKISSRRTAYNSAIFLDGDSDRAQMYIFKQAAYYSYEKVDEVKGVTLNKLGPTPEAFYALWDTMYTALQSSSDIYTIVADIRRAFGDRVLTKLTPPAVDETVIITKLDPVLTSLMNMETSSVKATGSNANSFNDEELYASCRIYDGGNGILKCEPSYTIEGNLNTTEYITVPANFKHLNFVESDPTPDAVANAVRFHPVQHPIYESLYSSDTIRNVAVSNSIRSMGTELILSAYMVRLAGDGSGTIAKDVVGSSLIYHNNQYSSNRAAMQTISDSANFDWSMPVMLTAHDSTNGVVHSELIEDIQNYVPISEEVLTEIHNAILLSEFGLN